MKVYFMFSKVYALALCIFLLTAFSFLAVAGGSIPKVALVTEAERAGFIKQYGYTVGDPVTVKTITVPAVMDDEYEKYAQILKKGGFDISLYKGKTLTEYTYMMENEIVFHLLLDKENLVGADCCIMSTGSIHTLAGDKIGTDKTG